MKRFYSLITFIFLTVTLYSHPWKPSHYVIVDTDGGIDDMKAITMLLSSPDVRVLAITVSPGTLSAENTYIKVRSLLNSFYHEGIPVGINRNSAYKSQNLPVALKTSWGDEINITSAGLPDHLQVINEILSYEKTKISFICLAGMTTAYHALTDVPVFKQQVRELIWSADGAGDTKGFNYNIDKEASVKMLKQEIPVKIVRGFYSQNGVFFNEYLIDSIESIKTIYSKKISSFFRSQVSENHTFSYSGSDEMAVVFLHYPELFISKVAYSISDCTPSAADGLRNAVIKILKGETVARNQVIKEFPDDPSFYFDDINSTVTEIIEKYGIDEWSSGVLANELHRHLGVFAIVGVKMGIRAREYFNTGVDEFVATSFAGSVPPLSCMNDGIQVSTGATPGHGLLKVIEGAAPSASAEFTYLNRKIRLILKPEISEKISSELKEINFIYGLDSNIYWELVRKNSIKYWRDLDRHEIFTIEEIK